MTIIIRTWDRVTRVRVIRVRVRVIRGRALRGEAAATTTEEERRDLGENG
jgi:hypothetical protein